MRSSFALAAAFATFVWAAPAAADLTVFEAPSAADFKLDLYGWVQPRFTYQQQDTRPEVNFTPNPAFIVQRARMGTIGTLGPWARAQVEVDFSGETATPIDAFVTLTPIHEKVATLNLTAGQFRVPISRQNLLPSVGLQFPDLAYFVAPNFLIDRDIGAKLWSDLFDGRLRVELGVYDSNDPGRGQKLNSDPYFLWAARIEVSPLGRPPSFEGDLRPLGHQRRPVLMVSASVMRDRFDDKHFNRNWVGADLAAYYQGASLYAEFFYHLDDPIPFMGTTGARVLQIGWNVQAGYFPPLPWVREHLEVAARVQSFDPNVDVKHPTADAGERDLTGSNPTWGYIGYVFGLNYFLNHRHTVKAQASYEIRNETKQCLSADMPPNCHGFIKNDLFVAQITSGF
jgi:hypothetical protein